MDRKCPTCGVPFEIGSLDTGTEDVGYCPKCSRQYRVSKETGEFKSLTVKPICHECLEQVERVERDNENSLPGYQYYRCPKHVFEAWEFRANEKPDWIWVGDETQRRRGVDAEEGGQ
jgi:hypothetical protein